MSKKPLLPAQWPTAVLAIPALLFSTAACAAPDLPRQADLSVSGILLDDAASAKTPFGAPPDLDDPDSDHPKAFICNGDKTEKLVLVYYEGDTANIVSELRVERVDAKYVDCVHPAERIARFVSGKGIRLGMPRNEVTRILGKNFTEHPQLDETVISYRIDNKTESDFLQRHSSPAYYGQYHFRENRLVKFSFGFEFP